MPFSIIPTSSSIISLPQSAISPGGLFTGTIATTGQRDIFTTIVEKGRSALFQNPVGDAITGISTNIGLLSDAVNSSACFSAGEITSITEAINNTGSGTIGLTQAVESFTLHTNTLSGLISPSTTNPTPSLERVLSVGRSLNNLNYALNSAEECFSFLNNMTGLFSTETMNGYIGQIAGLIESVNSCLLSASQIIAQINQIATTIQSIVDADNAFFAQALERLKQYALASILDSIYSDPCGRFLMSNSVGNATLNSILRSSVQIIK